MIRLKDLTLKSKVIQSPMAGCTDLAFRLIAREYGMEFAFLEMVSSESLVRKNAKTFGLLKTDPKDKPLGAQLVGCNADVMGEAAAMIEGMGFDLVDINIGCPVPKIVSPGGGSALLKEPDKAQNIFQKMVKAVKRIPVTAKMRIGFCDNTGKEAVHIARMAEDAGLSAIAVHGRTRQQGYSGASNWEVIGKIKQAVRIPVFGNGDVAGGEDALAKIGIASCDGIMIGRGGLGNPWIYKSVENALMKQAPVAAPTFEEKKTALLRHFELELQTEDPRLAVLKMRKIASWYFKGVPGASAFRDAIHRAETTDEVRDLITRFVPGSGPELRDPVPED